MINKLINIYQKTKEKTLQCRQNYEILSNTGFPLLKFKVFDFFFVKWRRNMFFFIFSCKLVKFYWNIKIYARRGCFWLRFNKLSVLRKALCAINLFLPVLNSSNKKLCLSSRRGAIWLLCNNERFVHIA